MLSASRSFGSCFKELNNIVELTRLGIIIIIINIIIIIISLHLVSKHRMGKITPTPSLSLACQSYLGKPLYKG